jgi:hypothetical protein
VGGDERQAADSREPLEDADVVAQLVQLGPGVIPSTNVDLMAG